MHIHTLVLVHAQAYKHTNTQHAYTHSHAQSHVHIHTVAYSLSLSLSHSLSLCLTICLSTYLYELYKHCRTVGMGARVYIPVDSPQRLLISQSDYVLTCKNQKTTHTHTQTHTHTHTHTHTCNHTGRLANMFFTWTVVPAESESLSLLSFLKISLSLLCTHFTYAHTYCIYTYIYHISIQ